jgi:integrase
MGRRANGDGTVTRRADGRYEARLTLPPDGSGKQRRKSFYGETRQEALTKLRTAQAALIHAGQEPLNQRITVGHFLTRWLTEVAAPTIRPKTLEQYTHIIEAYLVPGLGAIQLARLTPVQVQAFLNRVESGAFVPLRKGPTTQRPGPRTIQQCYRVLHTALNQALKWGEVHRNVAALVDTPAVPKAQTAALTPDQARLLLTATAGTRWGPLWALAIHTGLRRGELLALRWHDVDWAGQLLHIRGALDASGKRVATKTAGSVRTVPVSAEAIRALQARRAAQRLERVHALHWAGTDLIFTTLEGRPLMGDNMGDAFQADLRRAGLPHVRFHDLRHTCASLLAAQGVPIEVVQRLLGHTSIKTTADVYVHVTPDAQRDAVARLGALLEKEA